MKRIKLLLLGMFLLASGWANGQFITTWKTDNSGSSNDNQITIPTTAGTYLYDITWEEVGDPTNAGTEPLGQIGNYTITFPSAGIYQVSISGTFPRIYFNAAGFFGDDTDHDKLLTIEQWGAISWSSMANAFSGCSNLQINASDAPDLFLAFDLSNMFKEASSLNADLSSWNVSSVELFNGMFWDATSFNGDITNWDVSGAEEMEEMFYFASSFNQNIGGWHTQNVNTMKLMFAGATVFNQDIRSKATTGAWNTGSVTNMDQMFSGTEDFNQPIGNWDVSNVNLIRSMFASAHAFNQDVSSWTITNVSSLSGMFRDATSFNQPLSAWNTEINHITNLSGMFDGATAFNQDISGWLVGNVTNMSELFEGTTFNPNIIGWDVSSVTSFHSMFHSNTGFNQDISGWTLYNNTISSIDMRLMFDGATAFDQNIGGWNMTRVNNLYRMLSYSGLSVENYDNLLIGWAGQALSPNEELGAEGLFYCAGATARNILTGASNNWFITDAGAGCINVFEGADTTGPEITNGQPDVIDFGSINISPATKTLSFTIENKTGSDLSGFTASVTGTAFTITVQAPPTINAGFPETIEIELSNVTAGGPFTETVTFTSTVPVSSFSFVITGEVTDSPEPEMAVFEGNATDGTIISDGPSTFFIGNDLRGTNVTNYFIIENKGSDVLNISAISVPAPFSLSPTTIAPIPIGDTQLITVTLDGTVGGNFSEEITIVNNDANENPYNFLLSGTIYGPEIAVFNGTTIHDPEITDGQSAPVKFGTTSIGTDIIRELTIGNYGRVDLNIFSISITGDDFSITSTLPTLIIAEEDGVVSSSPLEITLHGSVAGDFNETVTITNNDDDKGNFSFTISGTVNDPAGPKIYWTEETGNQINRSLLDGSLFEQFFTASNTPQGLALDTLNNEIYWSTNLGDIWKGTIDLTGIINPIQFMDDGTDLSREIGGITLDVAGDKIYWASTYDGEIKSADLSSPDPSSVTITPIVMGLEFPTSVAVDPANGKIYYTTNFNNGGNSDNIASLHQVDIDGANDVVLTTEVIAGQQFTYRDVKVDLINNLIFWSSGGDDEFNPIGKIYSADISDVSGTIASFNTITDNPLGIDLDIANNKIYWVDKFIYMDPYRIGRANYDGSFVTEIQQLNLGQPKFLVLDVPPATASCSTTATANAGADQTICSGDNVNLSGTVGDGSTSTSGGGVTLTATITSSWSTSGDGSFNDATLVNAIYTPGTNDRATGLVVLTLSANVPNCPPVTDIMEVTISVAISAINQTATVNVTESITINLLNGSVINTGDVITTTLLSQPQKGNVVLNSDGTIEYSASSGTIGTDSFTFQIENQCSQTASASVIITIPNAAPTFTDGNATALPGAPVTISIIDLITDLNGNIDLSSIQIIQQPGSGAPATLDANTNLVVDYTEIDFFGIDEVIIEACDVDGACTQASIFITVEAPPIEVFNAVSPNGDGKHDFLELKYIEAYPENEVKIFNRWGDVIFTIEGYNNQDNIFTGLASVGGNKELPTGTYYYTVILKTPSGDSQTVNGYFELRR